MKKLTFTRQVVLNLILDGNYILTGWAGRKKVALISFGYQNIFATSLSFDSGKISEFQNVWQNSL